MKGKLTKVIIPRDEVQDLKDLFVNFIKGYDWYKADIANYTYKALAYKPNIALENAYSILKTCYEKKFAKLYFDELNQKCPVVKLTENEVNNIWFFLCPVLGRVQNNKICAAFFEQIANSATWKIYNSINIQKQDYLLFLENEMNKQLLP